MVRQVVRRKILVIPYKSMLDGSCEFLMVQDRKTAEWGFISGGVKMNETPELAASRELLEETSGVLNPSKLSPFTTFTSTYRPEELQMVDRKRGEFVKSVYHVFLLKFDRANIDRFHPNKEVTNIRVAKYHTFENVWSFCDDVYFRYVSRLLN